MYAQQNFEKTEELQSKEEVVRLLTESFDYVLLGLQSLDDSKLGETVEKGPFKISRKGWLNKAKEHVTHHRGQCAVYLRLNGIAPPQYQLF